MRLYQRKYHTIISIHALHEESDDDSPRDGWFRPYFNPRSP